MCLSDFTYHHGNLHIIKQIEIISVYDCMQELTCLQLWHETKLGELLNE